jgi:TPR repeat protein
MKNSSVCLSGLGYLYWNGVGVPKNESLGIHYMERAADAGYTEAKSNLGLIY